MIIVSVGNYYWNMASIEDAHTFINLMSKAVPVEQDFGLNSRFRQKGGDDYIPDIEVTLRDGEPMSYADAMKALEAKKAKTAAA